MLENKVNQKMRIKLNGRSQPTPDQTIGSRHHTIFKSLAINLQYLPSIPYFISVVFSNKK